MVHLEAARACAQVLGVTQVGVEEEDGGFSGITIFWHTQRPDVEVYCGGTMDPWVEADDWAV